MKRNPSQNHIINSFTKTNNLREQEQQLRPKESSGTVSQKDTRIMIRPLRHGRMKSNRRA